MRELHQELHLYNRRTSRSFYFLLVIFIVARFLVYVLDVNVSTYIYLIFSALFSVLLFIINFRPKHDRLFLLKHTSNKPEDLFTIHLKIFSGAILFYIFMISGTLFLFHASQASVSQRFIEFNKITTFLVLPVLAIILPRVIASFMLLRAEYKKL